MKKTIALRVLLAISIVTWPMVSRANPTNREKDILHYISKSFETADIPGMSVVLIIDGKTTTHHFGYANAETQTPVTNQTLFQLGSCSKAFTALAIEKLIGEHVINPEASVSDYIPWLHFQYKGSPVDITIGQLLHHTSGIPWNTLANIPQGSGADLLERTVQTLSNIALHRKPGEDFEYATINYDVLALVIEKVSGRSFEDYLKHEVLMPLQLNSTSIGTPINGSIMSTGYKVGFFHPIRYDAPDYSGNNAAAYVISNAKDMVRWLTYQMSLDTTSLTTSITRTHLRDGSVAPIDNQSYAAGWFVSLAGDGVLFHAGMNPNYTSFTGFRAGKKDGVVILSNSNSEATERIGHNVLRLLGGKDAQFNLPGDNSDRAFSTVSFILSGYCVVVLAFIGYIFYAVAKGNRRRIGLSLSMAVEVLASWVFVAPFLYGLYKLPNAMAGFTWEPTLVWMPISFYAMTILILSSLAITYMAYMLSMLYPDQNKHTGALPKLLLISALSGIANMVLILLITSALNSGMEMKFLVFYFTLTLCVYLAGRRFVQIRLITLTRDLIYDLRIKLIEKIFSTTYQKFEKIDRGRIYTAFNDDVGTVGESTNMFIMLVTNLFTAMAAMVYLATIAFWATALTTLLVLSLCTIYYIVSKGTHHYFEEARDSRNVFMRLLNGMIDGFKEISMHLNKKVQYRQDVADSANDYRQKISIASIQYVKASLVGEAVLILILGTAAFAFPMLFPGIQLESISMFIIVLLYLIGPVNAILSSVPAMKRLRIAWDRVQQFLREIPANQQIDFALSLQKTEVVHNIRVEDLTFSYNNREGEHAFDVGPVNLEVSRGEILFVIGGNGSGKTTLAKLLTGLYEPKDGKIYINDREATPSQLGENFSAVFNPLYLFDRLYNIDVTGRKAEINRYLDLLDIRNKVEVLDNGTFSTTSLSGGQRKRLALLLCYLEDSPVYLFDEWAADQDPEYRKIFYRVLLPEMKKMGKIVIAITHDDHYFDIADRVVKMNQGRLEDYVLRHAEEEVGAG